MEIYILTSRANDELGTPAASYSYKDAYAMMEAEFIRLSKTGGHGGIEHMSAWFNKPGFSIEWQITKVNIQ